MALKIRENLERVRRGVQNGSISGVKLASDARDAVFAGIGSPEWEKLMLNFVAAGTRELERLCGRDEEFRKTEWGELCLVYIAGDSACTSETAMKTGTGRSMGETPSRRMLEIIDAEEGDPPPPDDENSEDEDSDAENLNNPGNTDAETNTSDDKDQ